VGIDERRADRVHESVVDVGFQFHIRDRDADDVILGAA
jgi:hypothetical protein